MPDSEGNRPRESKTLGEDGLFESRLVVMHARRRGLALPAPEDETIARLAAGASEEKLLETA